MKFLLPLLAGLAFLGVAHAAPEQSLTTAVANAAPEQSFPTTLPADVDFGGFPPDPIPGCGACNVKYGLCLVGCNSNSDKAACQKSCRCMMSSDRWCAMPCNFKHWYTECAPAVTCFWCHARNGQCRSGCNYAPDIHQCYVDCDCYSCHDQYCHDNCGYNCDECKDE